MSGSRDPWDISEAEEQEYLDAVKNDILSSQLPARVDAPKDIPLPSTTTTSPAASELANRGNNALADDIDNLLQSDLSIGEAAELLEIEKAAVRKKPVEALSAAEALQLQKAQTEIYDFDSEDEILKVLQKEFWGRELKFWEQWELYRLAKAYAISADQSDVVGILEQTLKEAKDGFFMQTWKMVRERLAANLPRGEHIAVAEVDKRAMAVIGKCDARTGSGMWKDTLQLGARICLVPGKGPKVKDVMKAVVKPNPIVARETSNRYWRRFGSDRFLTLGRPSVKGDKRPLLLESAEKEGIVLLGRVWRTFYFHERSSKEKLSDVAGNDTNGLILFAVSGPGLQTISVFQMVSWLIPMFDPRNSSQVCSKLFSRIHLGLSDTIPTIQFTSDQIQYIPDIISGTGQELTDGCGIISAAAMAEVQRQLDLDSQPSVIQIRIAGAKGLLVKAPPSMETGGSFVKIPRSMVKFHPEDSPDHRTLEVLKWSKPARPARINNQFIQIIVNNGVKKEVLGTVMQELIDSKIVTFKESCRDPLGLLDWLAVQNIMPAAERCSTVALPPGALERTRRLSELHRRFGQCEFLTTSALQVLESSISNRGKSKMNFEIAKSTSVWCVPDFTGTLAPGEIYLRLSQSLGPSEGQESGPLKGDVLVGRIPAYTASDIQKVRAIDSEELRTWAIYDCVVFSTREPERSLASLLSGGDYDGDNIYIFWDQRLVGPFVSKPEDNRSVEPFIQDLPKKRVSDVLRDCGGDEEAAFSVMVNDQLPRCLDSGIVGLATYYYDAISYQASGIEAELAKNLAAVANGDLDSAKQGYSIDLKKWSKLKAEASNRLHDNNGNQMLPKYKTDPPPMYDPKARYPHPLDYLRFQIVGGSLNAVKEWGRLIGYSTQDGDVLIDLFKSKLEAPIEHMLTMTRFWKEKSTKAARVLRNPQDEQAIIHLIGKVEYRRWEDAAQRQLLFQNLREELAVIEAEWSAHYNTRRASDDFGKLPHAQFNQQILGKYRGIMPSNDLISRNPVIRDWIDITGAFSVWDLVKASTFYHIRRRRSPTLVWILAYRELCLLAGGIAGVSFETISTAAYDNTRIRTSKSDKSELKRKYEEISDEVSDDKDPYMIGQDS